MVSKEDPKAECKSQMASAGEKASDILEHTQGIEKYLQRIKDLSDAGRVVIDQCDPVHPDYERFIDAWGRTNSGLDELSRTLSGIKLAALNSTASGLEVTMSDFAVSFTFIPSTSPGGRSEGQTAVGNLNDVLDRSVDRASIVRLMCEFGLDRPFPGNKSAVEQLQVAWEAYERPLTRTYPAVTSLIPIRSSIEITIDALLRRRPRQEPASSWQNKVLSIASQLCRDGISREQVNEWANQCHDLMNELSDSKEGDISRFYWYNDLRKATFFIESLLLGLDPSKLR